MNKIVLEHYPVEKLPEDLRVGLPGTGSARVTVEITKEEDNPFLAFFGSPKDDAEINVQANFKKLLDDFDAHPERYNHGTTMEEAVRRIRELRDEWDDE